ncbi:beta-defensin 108B [Ovis aries]|nr:beta-defensin 108B [Ovis aries]
MHVNNAPVSVPCKENVFSLCTAYSHRKPRNHLSPHPQVPCDNSSSRTWESRQQASGSCSHLTRFSGTKCAPTGSQCSECPTKGGFSGFLRRLLWRRTALRGALRRWRSADIRPRRPAAAGAADRSVLCLLETKPSGLLSPAMSTAVPLFTILFLMSHVPPGSASFRELCERPNGSCQEFCLDSEIHSGRCLDGRPCCLPLVNVPEVDPTTPRVR